MCVCVCVCVCVSERVRERERESVCVICHGLWLIFIRTVTLFSFSCVFVSILTEAVFKDEVEILIVLLSVFIAVC